MPIFLNGKALTAFKFPGGECHVRVQPSEIGEYTEILASLYSSDDILLLLLTVDAVRRCNGDTQIKLTIPYFPYARQDRVCNPGEPLSVKVMAGLINALQCQEVVIYDPHSDVTAALIENVKIIPIVDIITDTPLSHLIIANQLGLVSPDAGAEKKVQTLAKGLSTPTQPLSVFCARKVRDPLTGAIVATEIHDDVKQKNLILIDDICDGGQTFIELAKVLKQNGVGDIYLYITHGIFSKGLSVLKPWFKAVYCYHTLLEISQIDTEFLTVLSDNPVLPEGV